MCGEPEKHDLSSGVTQITLRACSAFLLSMTRRMAQYTVSAAGHKSIGFCIDTSIYLFQMSLTCVKMKRKSEIWHVFKHLIMGKGFWQPLQIRSELTTWHLQITLNYPEIWCLQALNDPHLSPCQSSFGDPHSFTFIPKDTFVLMDGRVTCFLTKGTTDTYCSPAHSQVQVIYRFPI